MGVVAHGRAGLGVVVRGLNHCFPAICGQQRYRPARPHQTTPIAWALPLLSLPCSPMIPSLKPLFRTSRWTDVATRLMRPRWEESI